MLSKAACGFACNRGLSSVLSAVVGTFNAYIYSLRIPVGSHAAFGKCFGAACACMHCCMHAPLGRVYLVLFGNACMQLQLSQCYCFGFLAIVATLWHASHACAQCLCCCFGGLLLICYQAGAKRKDGRVVFPSDRSRTVPARLAAETTGLVAAASAPCDGRKSGCGVCRRSAGPLGVSSPVVSSYLLLVVCHK